MNKDKNKEERYPIGLKVPIRLLAKLDGLAKKNRRSRTAQLIVILESVFDEKEEEGGAA